MREHCAHSTFRRHSHRVVCVGTLSALGPSVKWKTHTDVWVLRTVVRRVSFLTGEGVLPCEREKHVWRLKNSTPGVLDSVV